MFKTRTSAGIIVLLVLVSVVFLCGFGPFSDMPFNGDISFHDLSITIPETYIRDSTQSHDDFWLFEKGWYSSYIMLSRQDLLKSAGDTFIPYAAYLREQGAKSQRLMFLDMPALRSSDFRGEQAWQEMMFAHDGSLYAIALRGGDADEFQALLDSAGIIAEK